MTRQILLLLTAALLAACSTPTPADEQPPQATLTLVPSTTPDSGQGGNLFDRIQSGFTAEGFPTLGQNDAPARMVEYGSYDSIASGLSHTEIFIPLLPRIESGEVRYTFIPLTGTGTLPNGTGAARAALCAGEQDAFWEYHTQLYALQQRDRDVFDGASLTVTAEALGLDTEAWNACALGENANTTLRAASEAALELESYAGTPTILLNDRFALNDFVALNSIIDQILESPDGLEPAAGLPTPDPNAPTATPEPRLDSSLQAEVPAPLDITLPDQWIVALSDTLLLPDIDGVVRTIPFTLWRGPVDGGVGSIVLLWGFPNVTTGDMFAAQSGLATPVPNLRIDGSRLLRFAVVEQGCNVGTDLEREYTVGGLTGVGTEWSAVGCPELPDTRGWFVGVRQFDLNFIFYAYVDPIDPNGVTEAEQVARGQLQAILDTVRFRQIDGTPTAPLFTTPVPTVSP